MGSKFWVLGTQYSLRGQTEVRVGLGNLFQRKAVVSLGPRKRKPRPDPKSFSPSLESLSLRLCGLREAAKPLPTHGLSGLSLSLLFSIPGPILSNRPHPLEPFSDFDQDPASAGPALTPEGNRERKGAAHCRVGAGRGKLKKGRKVKVPKPPELVENVTQRHTGTAKGNRNSSPGGKACW